MPDLKVRLQRRREQVQEADAAHRRVLAIQRDRALAEAQAPGTSCVCLCVCVCVFVSQ